MTAAAGRAITEARALMAAKRANLCRHGVTPCHDCDRAKAAVTTQPPAPPAEHEPGTHPDAERVRPEETL